MMSPSDPFAEALADGRPVDWAAAVRDAATPDEREVIAALRDLASLGEAFAGEVHRSGIGARARSSLVPGTEWGTLRIVESVGQGRFGEVYRAWDPVLEREVALKLIHETPEAVETRVIDEGRLMARVRHPNVVTIHGAQRIDGVTGLWMEFVAGRTLDAELAARGPFAADELVRVARDLAGALGAVHDAGLVHRDVKATNVIRDAGGRVILGDFGTGVVADDAADEATGFAGTPAYVAPEIYLGRPATAASDLYSLGVLLFHLATRDYPVKGRTMRELRAAHAAADRSSLAQRRPDLPARLVQAIDRLLDPDPAKRLATAGAVLEAIQPRARRTRSWAVAAAITVAVAGAGVGAWVAFGPQVSGPTRLGLVLFPEHANLVYRGVAANGMIACQHTSNRGNVAVCDLQTSTPRVLRPYESETSFAPQGRSLLLSPDGTRVAYVWVTGPATARVRTVNVIPAAGGASVEIHRSAAGAEPLMHRWLADGSALLLSEPDGDGRRMFLLPADGSRQQEVWRFGPGYGQLADLSSDGRHLVATIVDTAANTRVVIVDRETKDERLAFGERGAYPLWTPAADAIVFEATRQGGTVVIRVPVRDGIPSDAPEIAWRFGRASVRPVGFSEDGALFVMHAPPTRTAYRVELDVTQARAGLRQLVDPLDVEDTIGADWSPDGRQIAYLRGRMFIGPQGPRATVVVRDVNGGIVNEIEVPGAPLPVVGQVRWAPDGARVAVTYGGDTARDTAMDVIDLSSRQRQRILHGPPFASPRWDASGQWVYYVTGAEIRRRHLASGVTDVAYRAADGSIRRGDGFDLNRVDGAMAILVVLRPATAGCVLRIVDASGAVNDRETFTEECVATAWTHDGSTLLVSTNASPTHSSLWRVDRTSGAPVRFPMNEPMYHVLSHGGGGLLYTTGNPLFSMAMLTGIAANRR